MGLRILSSKIGEEIHLKEATKDMRAKLQNWNKEIFGYIPSGKKTFLTRIRGIQEVLENRPLRFLSKLELDVQ